MVSLTKNEAKAIEFLLRNFSKQYSINRLAKELEISPGGMFKILKKLEARGLVKRKDLANSAFYSINYSSENALDACAFALSEKKTAPYTRMWISELEKLKDITYLAILFGSLLAKGREAGDVDALLIFDRKRIKEIDKAIDDLNMIKSKKIHAIYQTRDEFVKNIKNLDKAILEEIRAGIVLWGRDFLVEAIKDGQD